MQRSLGWNGASARANLRAVEAPDASAPSPDARRTNRIGGEDVPSQGAGTRVVRAATAPHEPLGVWPLSDGRDLRPAIEGARRAALVPLPGALAAELARVAEAALEARPAPAVHAALARRLGLAPAELEEAERRLAPDDARDGSAARRPRGRLETGTGEGVARVVLFALDWTELALPALGRVARALARGDALVLLPDPRAPMVGELVLAAVDALELPGGRLQVVHGVGPEELAACAPSLGEAADLVLRARTDPDRVAAWSRARAAWAGARALPLGRLHAIASATERLAPDADPEEVAGELLERAFGRARALGGYGPGQLGTLIAPPRRFARLTEGLLQGLERAEGLGLPPIDAEAAEALRALLEGGQDEGATWIPSRRAEARTGAEEGPSSDPALLTNVELGMACARRTRPLPALALLRG